MKDLVLWLALAAVTVLLVLGGIERFYSRYFVLSLGVLVLMSFLLAAVALIGRRARAGELQDETAPNKQINGRG